MAALTHEEIKEACKQEMLIKLQRIKDEISSTHSWKQMHPGFAGDVCEYYKCTDCNIQGSRFSEPAPFVSGMFLIKDNLPTDARAGDLSGRLFLTCEQNKHQKAVAKLPNKDWYVYMIECVWGNVYCGASNNPIKRFIDHCYKGSGAKYTRAFSPQKLIYVEKLGTKSEALKREYAIKQLSRDKKLELIDATILEDIYKIDRKI